VAKETPEERRERIAKEVAARSEERRRKYFEEQEKAKAAAEAKLPPLPKPDVYVYDYNWRQEVGGPGGKYVLTKTPNPAYDPSTNTVVDPATGVRNPVVMSTVGGKTEKERKTNPDGSITITYTDGTTSVIPKPSDGGGNNPPTGYSVVNGVLQYNGNPFTGAYQGKNYVNGVEQKTVSGDGNNDGQGGGNAELLAIIASLQNTIAGLTNKSTTDAAATKAANDLAERQSAFDVLYAEMDGLGLAALVEPLRGLIQKNVSPSEFAVELRQSEAYKMRFAANEVRLKKGLRALTPGEYIRVEDAYRQTLRSYGLKQFDNDEYVRQFIENDISAAELSDRVSMAVQRVQNADPAVARTLRDFYGIGQADLVAYVLDPNQQAQKIQRQIAAAEIGTAARLQGINAGVGVAEQLAAQGVTQAEAQRGYATIANILPTAEKLSQIYGATMEEYGLAEAEQEVFNQLASAQRRRERLTQREIAQFSGQSGLGRTSLSQTSRGQF
jgi:hypothetical protein